MMRKSTMLRSRIGTGPDEDEVDGVVVDLDAPP